MPVIDSHNKEPRYIRIILVFVVLGLFVIAATYYGTKTLSAVRAYVTGEGIWTKSQKIATRHLIEYSLSEKPEDYRDFKEAIGLQHSFSRSRKTMISADPNYQLAQTGFEASPLLQSEDIDLMFWLGSNFHNMPYVKKSFAIWKEADDKIIALDRLAEELYRTVSTGALTVQAQKQYVSDINLLDTELTDLENSFSATLNEGAHHLQITIFWTIVGTGILLVGFGYLVTASNFKRISNLNDKLEHLSLVSSKTTDLVVITDAHERVTWVNQTFEDVTGYTLENIQGMVPGHFLQGPETSLESRKAFAKGVAEQQPIREQILNYTKTGKKLWLDITIDPVFNEEGECTHFIAIERDATKEVLKQKEIKESLERYNIVARATSDTIWDYDLKTNSIRYNDVVHNMFGYSATEISQVYDWWEEKIHPEDKDKVTQKLEEVLAGDIDRFQLEYRFKCADGSYKHIYDRAFVVSDDNGTPSRIIGAMQDITQRIAARKEQEKSRKLLQAITSNAETPIWIRDENGQMILANKEWRRLFNLENKQLIGKKLDDLISEQMAREFKSHDKKVIESGTPRMYYEHVNIAGEDHYFVTSMFPLWDVPGLNRAVGGVSTDITGRKQAEEKLKATEKRMREIIEHSTNMFYRHTSEHVLTYVSPQAHHFLGCDPQEAMTRWTEFITDHPVNKEGVKKTEKAISTGKTQPPFELELQKKDGGIIWVEVNEAPIVEDGETTAIVGSLTDITQRKKARLEITEALKEKEMLLAEVHHRVKKQYGCSIWHDAAAGLSGK